MNLIYWNCRLRRGYFFVDLYRYVHLRPLVMNVRVIRFED